MKFLLIFVLGFTSIQIYAKKCADFSTQQQAQKWYEQRKKSGQTGWKSLDRDGDGQACDCLPVEMERSVPRRGNKKSL